MSHKRIIQYGARWNLKARNGLIMLYFSENKDDHFQLMFHNADEFNATLAILATSYNSYLTDDGAITSGWEPVNG
jgi:hypothetical protein